MFRTLTFAVLVFALAPLSARAATAQSSNRFLVNRPYEEILTWFQSHRTRVYGASNCRILRDYGHGQYLCQTNTPVGAMQYTVQETVSRSQTSDGRAKTTYNVQSLSSVSGRLANQRVVITLTDLGDRTEISMWMTTSVSGRFVPVAAVARVQSGSLAGCQQYIQGSFRHS